MQKLRILILFLLSISGATASAAAPASYYDDADGLYGQQLIRALCDIINTHTALSYSNVWKAYETTDLDSNGKVWDMYSTKRWNYGKEQCGSYSSIGSCYNREHSFPKSWFDDASPMYTDVHHLYPTDGRVNGQRGNNPFGECENGTYVPSNGSVKALGKLGTSTFPGYSGTVFEPDDMYKGDFARTYFYMATCYNDRNSSWHSDMLAGNSYPFFKTWAINLLLKWHRQDPVSEKELKRNDAVYALQHNRNPFIDHPELAEHIWGNKKTERWSATGTAEAVINQPVDGSAVDFGVTARYMPVQKTIAIRTSGATANVTVTASGPFAVNGGVFTATEANAGTSVKVQYQPTTLGQHTGTLIVTTGSTKSTVSLTAKAVDGLPVGKATYVTSESFRANWTYIGDDFDGKYELTVADIDGALDGYPVMVDAKQGYYDVRDLQPETIYTYTLRSRQLTSDGVLVETAPLLPMVDFLFDGDLYFSTVPGVPSEVAEILVHIENIATDITVSVGKPFELSFDRSEWSQSLTLKPDESRLYMRLNSETAGTFESTLTARAGDYVNDNTTVSGIATDQAAFVEDFEAQPAPASSYGTSVYNGTAAVWNLYNAGYWADTDKGHDGSAVAVRLGKASNNMCGIEMADSKQRGAGVISFWAKKWNDKEATPNIAVETSTDDGATWHEAGNADITSADWQEYTFTANIAGDVRVRLRRTKGARMHVDGISISDYTTGVSDPYAERHLWDAYGSNGTLTVTVDKADGIEAGIYTVGGITLFEGRLAEGTHSWPLAPGTFVLVSCGDFTRTVLIR